MNNQIDSKDKSCWWESSTYDCLQEYNVQSSDSFKYILINKVYSKYIVLLYHLAARGLFVVIKVTKILLVCVCARKPSSPVEDLFLTSLNGQIC